MSNLNHDFASLWHTFCSSEDSNCVNLFNHVNSHLSFFFGGGGGGAGEFFFFAAVFFFLATGFC